MLKSLLANYILKSVIGFLILTMLSCSEESTLEVAQNLSISEGFKNPLGFYDASPSFSWKLPVSDGVKSQSAYNIVAASNLDLLPNNADLWDSKKQETDQSVWIKYDGKPLQSRQKVYWQVKYWNQDGEPSRWSEINHFELGLLNNTDWQAKWVGLDTAKDSVRGRKKMPIHKPQYLRKDFELSNEVASARLYITAKGVFDVAINGEDVSDDVLSPGFTSYNKRIETLTYDVTDLIETGQNTIGVELASGWYSGRLLWTNTAWNNKVSPKILCQLELRMKDGSKETIISDATWKGITNGPIQFSEIYDGEIYNANLEIPNWTTNNFDNKDWLAVEVENIDTKVKLEPKRHTTVKGKIELQPQEIIKKEKTVIFDLKQNMVGVPLVKVPMKKGDTLKVRFSEMLLPDGTFYTKNYRGAHSTDYYIAAQDGNISYKPKFTFHGFRFVELSGFDASQEPTTDWVTGIVQYSDFDVNGSFRSSHEKLNQLQSNIVWGLRGNFLDIPTDCPQRNERLGWTGDAQVFGPTSLFNADVYKFWASWMQSVKEAQYENGAVPFVVPDVRGKDIASSGWGDVCTIIPWKIYFRTGDKRILEENYRTMENWVGYHEEMSDNFISNMFSYADWLQPHPKNGDRKGDTSHSLISTAFFAHSAKLTAQTAKVLGKHDDYNKYNNIYKKVADAFEKEYFDESGKVKDVTATQTSYLLAIAFNLLSEDKIARAEKYLLEKIEEADNHLRTGFLGTPLLSEVLDNMGEIDLMYKLLLNETYPSWFYSINQGATTIWERWNSYSKTEGYNPDSMNSLNHYAYGAIGQWMYERIAGIQPVEAGYKEIRIAPLPGGPLTSAEATYNSPYGKISSSWKIENGTFKLTTTIPPNTSAKIVIPTSDAKSLTLDGKDFSNSENVKLLSESNDIVEIEAMPGTYMFESKLH